MTSGWRTRFESGRRWSPISNSRDCFPRNSVCSHDPDYVARDEAELLDLTQRSSAVTHNHSDAITDGIAEVMFGLPDDIAEIARGYLATYLVEAGIGSMPNWRRPLYERHSKPWDGAAPRIHFQRVDRLRLSRDTRTGP